MQELQQRQYEITNKIEGQVEDDKVFQITLKALLALCSNSYEIFESSQIEQKRKLMSFVLANLQIKDGTVCYSLRKPFDELVNLAKNQEWLDKLNGLRTRFKNEILLFSTQVNQFQAYG